MIAPTGRGKQKVHTAPSGGAQGSAKMTAKCFAMALRLFLYSATSLTALSKSAWVSVALSHHLRSSSSYIQEVQVAATSSFLFFQRDLTASFPRIHWGHDVALLPAFFLDLPLIPFWLELDRVQLTVCQLTAHLHLCDVNQQRSLVPTYSSLSVNNIALLLPTLGWVKSSARTQHGDSLGK